MNGELQSFSIKVERAHCQGHEPRMIGGNFIAAATGVYPAGLLLTRLEDRTFTPLAEVAAEVIGTGTGSATTFAGTLDNALLSPGSLSITDGVETFDDDGCGRLVGDATGTGTINYKTGAYSVTFDTAVVSATSVEASYFTSPDAVLDEGTDTDRVDVGLMVIHGTVTEAMLKVGETAEAGPSDALLLAMEDKGLYPV
jgi:hypothetical protein